MTLEGTRQVARQGSLYPSVILHGGDAEGRREEALGLARILLCAAPAGERPCGSCGHCRRIVWPGPEELFHPDFQVLERDLRTATSAAATRELLRTAQMSPYEARGQVFVVAEAESLSPEAADALLKVLEEPADSAPRHFLLLAPSRLDLSATLRSRSLSVYLGAGVGVDQDSVDALTERVAASLEGLDRSGSAVYLLTLARSLVEAGDWRDAPSGQPWALVAAALRQAARGPAVEPELRRRLLDLALEALEAPQWRLRGIPPERILEGLVVRHLGSP